MYNMGKTHKVLAPIVEGEESALKVATKVNPWFLNYQTFAPEGGLSAAAVGQQIEESLADLGVESVDIMYLHAPDITTPVEETLAAIDAAHKAGKFNEFGLSNYAAWEVAHIHGLCKAAGYVLPTVYQGMYNMFTRGVEAELIPALRVLGMRFYAYNITAGGLLTGKHKADDSPDEGRFNGTTLWGQAYRKRFWNGVMFSAIESLNQALDAHAAESGTTISPFAAAIRYLAFHSKLTPEDGLILGASSSRHIVSNAATLKDGPLPESIVDAINSSAESCASVCPSYSRSFSNAKSYQ